MSPTALAARVSLILALANTALAPAAHAGVPVTCARTVTARVVALDQPFFLNRLGTHQPGGMVYALERDVVSTGDTAERLPGQVALRQDHRARPLVLRANEGDCLKIHFTNLLRPERVAQNPATRSTGIHIVGLSLVAAYDTAGHALPGIQADGSFAGTNPSGVVDPGGSITVVYRADAPGSYLLHSASGMLGEEDESDTFDLQYPSGQMTAGLFGAVNVQPRGAVWFRSQVSGADLARATVGRTPLGQPILDYYAKLPDGTPVLAMLDGKNEIVHGDLTAVIAYQGPGERQPGPFPEDPADPQFRPVPASPERTQPYREITAIYHQVFSTVQAFDCAFSPPINPATGERDYSLCEDPRFRQLTPYLFDALGVGEDRYAINYGSGGIGSEILSNRFGVGPAGDCTACKYEEFFLSSWPNGDPGAVVTVPTAPSAEFPEAQGAGLVQKVLYPDDPSNVYHSYLRDHVKFRVLQGAANFHHVHHLHAHQWLHTPNADNSHYLDSQAIAPGTSHTLEMVYNGSGNRNETVGDAIFHCHFYPHFAEGMWAMWRVHDVLEEGTKLGPDGLPVAPVWDGDRLVKPGARALMDPEIVRGTPIPAIVPLPSRPMPLPPATITLTADGKEAITLTRRGDGWQAVDDSLDAEALAGVSNPGYPFFIPGRAGQRPPRPPLDVAWATVRQEGGKPVIDRATPTTPGAIALDGGLPRALVTGSGDPGGPGTVELHTRLDFSKKLQSITARELPEGGVAVERIAMATHAVAEHPTCLPNGVCDRSIHGAKKSRPHVDFHLNGLPPVQGAPFADPCGPSDGAKTEIDPADPTRTRVVTRRYRGVNLQLDVALNKAGWHFPQQRIITLWDDVEPTLAGQRPPEPLFMRANSGECVEYWHANLVPGEYALDDFQVRTPTDIISQHIHLVKFDVTSSDGGANGFNYEDGSFAPEEVRERIEAINAAGGLVGLDGKRRFLEPHIHPAFGPGPHGSWIGAMTTVQRWMADPLLDLRGDDRTLRTVFTHDHFGPSTHQQAGLYAGLLVEPPGSLWVDSATGKPMGGTDPKSGRLVSVRDDGGPTSWRANVLATQPDGVDASFREFALEFQDIALAYPQSSVAFPDPLAFGAISIDPDAPPPPTNLQVSEIVRPLGQSPIPPWPQVISSGPSLGTYSLNYRNEPLNLRLADQAGYAPRRSYQVSEAQDFAHVFRSMERLYPPMNEQPPWYPPLTGGVGPTDPFTPLLEAYAGDRVQIRTLVGAHELVHQFVLRGGLSWLSEPSYLDSGYRSHQVMGISEHFEMQFTLPPNPPQQDADYLYMTDASVQGIVPGTWGLLRSYDPERERPFLKPLPNNPLGRQRQALSGIEYCSPESRDPKNGKYRKFSVLALAAGSFVDKVLPYSPAFPVKVAYEKEDGSVEVVDIATPLVAAEGLLYTLEEDVVKDPATGKWRLAPGRAFEPLVLRAAAGDCLEVQLTNLFDPALGAFNGDTPGADRTGDPQCTMAEYLKMRSNPHNFVGSFKADSRCFGGNQASTWVGLNPQLVSFDPRQSSGINAGLNPVQTPAAPGAGHEAPTRMTYYWYAGKVEWNDAGRAVWTPVEFGSSNLLAADVLHQHTKGLFGALVIEPAGSRWQTDPNTRVTATVTKPDGSEFREFVLISQEDLELSWLNPRAKDPFAPVPIVSAEALGAVNYGSAFLLFRLAPPAPWSVKVDPEGELTIFDQTAVDQTRLLTSQFLGGDPATPVFTAHAGTPVRFRLLHPGGIFEGHVFTVHGHGWPELPYQHTANPANPGGDPYRAIAQTLGNNRLAEWKGQQLGVGPLSHYDIVIEPSAELANGAGGPQKIPGDYLYRSFPAVFLEGGFWGIFRVGPQVPAGEKRDILAITTAERSPTGVTLTGSNSPILGTDAFADNVRIYAGAADPKTGQCQGPELPGRFTVTKTTGPQRLWSWQGNAPEEIVCATSSGGGTATTRVGGWVVAGGR